MLQVTYRKNGVRLSHVWFASKDELLKQHYKNYSADIYFIHGVSKDVSFLKEKGVLLNTQKSFLKDLSKSEEELFQSFGKHLRKHIRKCERDSEAEIKIFSSDDMLNNKDVLSICKYLFEKMFFDKGIKSKFNMMLAKKYCLNDALTAFVAYIDNKPVGCSLTVKDSSNARAWVSAFDYRTSDLDHHVLSRAHRLLNWKRLTYHRAEGIKWFDFGGITDFDNPDDKGKFKAEFGMDLPIEYYNYLIPNGIIGNLFICLKFRENRR